MCEILSQKKQHNFTVVRENVNIKTSNVADWKGPVQPDAI